MLGIFSFILSFVCYFCGIVFETSHCLLQRVSAGNLSHLLLTKCPYIAVRSQQGHPSPQYTVWTENSLMLIDEVDNIRCGINRLASVLLVRSKATRSPTAIDCSTSTSTSRVSCSAEGASKTRMGNAKGSRWACS